jgi:pimeloyl-ACP methyl ester carboxylesterase
VSEPSLNYRREGSGPALLLIHGLGGSLAVWAPVMDRLAAERDVIAVDLPGFGRSAMPDGFVSSAANMARSVEAFLGEIGVERPHAAGNSLGAWVALEMAKDGAVASVAAISPAGLWRQALGPRSYDAHGLGNRLRPLISLATRTKRGRRLILRTTAAAPDQVPAAAVRELVHGYLDSPGYAGANDEMRSHVFEHEDRIDVPVAIAWGELDRLVGRPSRTRRPPHATFVEKPGWGHTPTWDDPDGVAEFLLEASAG